MSLFYVTEANNLVEYRPMDWWKAADKVIKEASGTEIICT